MANSTDSLSLIKSNYAFDSNSITDVSLWLCYVYIAALFIIAIAFASELCKYAYKRCKHEYISKRPLLSLLWSVFLLEILVYTGMFWWVIKATIFFSSTRQYCVNVYSPIDLYVEQCRADVLCKTCVHGGGRSINEENYICDNGHDYDGSSNHDCYCARVGNHEAFMGMWWMVWGCTILWTVYHMFRIFRHRLAVADTHLLRRSGDCIWNPTHCIFWEFCCCATEKWKQSFFTNLYWRRVLWYGDGTDIKKHECGCDCGVCLQISFYILFIMFASIFYGTYSLMIDANSGMKWYDFCPVLLLLGIKLAMQQYYLRGNEYFIEQDWVPFIHEMVQQKYGLHLGSVIESYLPIFYNSKLCSQDLLLLGPDGQELDMEELVEVQIRTVNQDVPKEKDNIDIRPLMTDYQ